MKTQTSGVYIIFNIVDGKIYIGSSENMESRWRHHKSLLNNNNHPNPHLQRAWNRDGSESFQHIILVVENDPMKICVIEQKFMDFYGLPNAKCGYNIRKEATNNRGFRHSDATKIKLHKIMCEQWKKPSLREAFIASIKVRAEKNRKKVVCLETGVIFDSIAAAAKANNSNSRSISSSANRFCQDHGLNFRFVDANGMIIPRAKEPDPRMKPKPVTCNENGITYPSFEAAAKILNIKGGGSSVSRQVRGIRKKAGGYTFSVNILVHTT